MLLVVKVPAKACKLEFPRLMSRQGRRKLPKTGWASSNVGGRGTICHYGCDKVN
jgi:hypothetical protein